MFRPLYEQMRFEFLYAPVLFQMCITMVRGNYRVSDIICIFYFKTICCSYYRSKPSVHYASSLLHLFYITLNQTLSMKSILLAEVLELRTLNPIIQITSYMFQQGVYLYLSLKPIKTRLNFRSMHQTRHFQFRYV